MQRFNNNFRELKRKRAQRKKNIVILHQPHVSIFSVFRRFSHCHGKIFLSGVKFWVQKVKGERHLYMRFCSNTSKVMKIRNIELSDYDFELVIPNVRIT